MVVTVVGFAAVGVVVTRGSKRRAQDLGLRPAQKLWKTTAAFAGAPGRRPGHGVDGVELAATTAAPRGRRRAADAALVAVAGVGRQQPARPGLVRHDELVAHSTRAGWRAGARGAGQDG